jgi:hypothetical protein
VRVKIKPTWVTLAPNSVRYMGINMGYMALAVLASTMANINQRIKGVSKGSLRSGCIPKLSKGYQQPNPDVGVHHVKKLTVILSDTTPLKALLKEK